jgi:inorganic triphosphatase YgiF
MALEIELKLAVPAGAHDALVGWLDAHARSAGTVVLANVYYDTPDQALARNRAALRVRLHGEQWLQTLKTAAVSTAGLSARHEWEVPLTSDALSVDAFVAHDATEAADYVRAACGTSRSMVARSRSRWMPAPS